MDTSSPCAIAIRLADEGVPLRAIARATHIPSTQLYETLALARTEGWLLDLPRDDWPPGYPRDQRALQLSHLASEDRRCVLLRVQQLFQLTSTEAVLLLALIQNDEVSRERFDMASKTVDVHICRVRRRLAPFKISIRTLHGYGYQMSPAHRRKAKELVEKRT